MMRGEARQVSWESGQAPPVAYHDRSRAPAETVALMQAHFPALGITRIARQTGLDRLGVPCFAAFRPNSRSIACNQGKGIDDDSARASAVMEAVEFAIAENPLVGDIFAAAMTLLARGYNIADPRKALPVGEALDPLKPIRWLRGRTLGDGDSAEVMVPLDRVALNGEPADLPGICQNTNGLASGNTFAEAAFHAASELVERDANTLWSFLPLEEKRARCIDIASLGDPLVIELATRFERESLVIRLFDQTTSLGIPTILAVTAPADRAAAKRFDVAAGAGTHPHPARAALRAITEAAQTRVTSIAAARDDVRPDTYRLEGSGEAYELLRAVPCAAMQEAETGLSGPAEDLLAHVLHRLRRAGVDDLVAVPLGGEQFGISVVRVISDLLEDRGPNLNWKPGPRALGALLEP